MTDEGMDAEHVVGASRSLKRLSSGKDDLVGLIAYGLFKYEQSEWAVKTRPTRDDVERHHEQLQETRIESLRSNAEYRLTDWASELEKQWREDQYRDLANQVVADHSANVIREVRKASGFWKSVGAGVVSWGLTAVITVVVVLYWFAPSFVDMLKKAGGG